MLVDLQKNASNHALRASQKEQVWANKSGAISKNMPTIFTILFLIQYV